MVSSFLVIVQRVGGYRVESTIQTKRKMSRTTANPFGAGAPAGKGVQQLQQGGQHMQ